MNLLFIGDIVGPAGVEYVARIVPELRRERVIDLVIANAENAVASPGLFMHSFGIDLPTLDTLFACGVDVITSGNHAWDHADAGAVHAHPRVLRPFNLPPGRAGKGILTLEVNGETVTIVNLADTAAISDALPIFDAWKELDLPGTVIVDFHGGSIGHKFAFAHVVDVTVAAVIGTHTHEATLELHRLPKGTSLVIDVGMTGPTGGFHGIALDAVLPFLTENRLEGLPPMTLTGGPIILGAVIIEIKNGRTHKIERIPTI